MFFSLFSSVYNCFCEKAFYEDNDWNIRVLLWGKVKWTTFMDIYPWHGLRPQNMNHTFIANISKAYISGTEYLKSVR